MRTAERVCRTVVLRMRFDDFTRATRSHTLAEPTAHTETLMVTARSLLDAAMPMIRTRGLTLIGLSLSNLENDDAIQLALPFDPNSGGGLDVAIDDLRDRFGSAAVTRAVLLGRDAGMSVPMLPD